VSITGLVAAIIIRSISDGDNNIVTVRLEVSGIILLPRGHYINPYPANVENMVSF